MFGIKGIFMYLLDSDPPTKANLQALRRRQRQSNCPQRRTANGAENGAWLCFAVRRGKRVTGRRFKKTNVSG